MQPVEINVLEQALTLRARQSELYILPQHVEELQKLSEPKQFSTYFINEALVNRTARRLFESWLRRDPTVWMRLFKAVHQKKPVAETGSDSHVEKVTKTVELAEKTEKKASKESSIKEEAAKAAKAKTSKVKTKAKAKKAEAKPETKTTKAVAKKVTKKKVQSTDKKKKASKKA